MKFSSMIERLPEGELVVEGNPEITGISERASEVEAGNLFVAVRGLSVDGHDYAAKAIERGASALIVERRLDLPAPQFRVSSGRRALAWTAAAFFSFPHREITLVGVTGTNGKTSTAHLIRGIWEQAGRSSGILGTIGHGAGNALEEAQLTTPGPVELNRRLREFVDRGCDSVVMEVSSHAVSQYRIDGLEFDGAIFTNITRDHLDFHESFEEYLEAKTAFCRGILDPLRVKPPGTLIYGRDDPHVREMGASHRGKKIAFGLDAESEVKAENIDARMTETIFSLVTPDGSAPVRLDLAGAFNVHNALAAAAWTWGEGVDTGTVVAGLESVRSIAGRFEIIKGSGGPAVIVDYAHTPDALDRVLQEARKLAAGRLFAVFGCGGDRDRGKRPMMGRVATSLADVVVVTSDNPRTEDPAAIIDQILAGIEESVQAMSRGTLLVEEDRRRAIHDAVGRAGDGDVVVVAGKGHEDYQILGTTKIHFDDREVVREALGQARGEGESP